MIVAVNLVNDFGDTRTIECDVAENATGSAVAAEAVELANANPPQGWPYGVPIGTWRLYGFERVSA